MSQSNEAITIIMSGRDRFSQTADCIENLLANTPQPYDLIVVLGGAPKQFEDRLRKMYGAMAKLVFEDRFLNCSEARNIGLKLATTRLSVCMDNDVFVRPGWLAPLVRCAGETSAGVVVPLILEDERHIHCAGNDMFITKKGGRSFVCKVLRYCGQPMYEGTNLERCELDYGEMHLQLIDTKAALELGVHDERIQEGQELDSGLIWRNAGRSIWFEPASVVVYGFPMGIEHPGDIAFFCWRWNAANMIPGYKVKHEKWNMDMTEAGGFKHFILGHNAKVGWLLRLWPSWSALTVDRAMGRAFAFMTGTPHRIWQKLYGLRTGYYEWIANSRGGMAVSHRISTRFLSILSFGSGENRDVERVEIKEDIYLEVFRAEEGAVHGPGASLFAKGEEVLRLPA